MNARIGAVVVLAVFGGIQTMPANASGQVEGASLSVEITGLKNDRGNVKLAIWRTKDGFPRDESKAVKRFMVPIVGRRASLLIENIEPGPWAVAAFHDENDNNRVETNFLGIPKEGLGVSRDAKGVFGPPSFEAAKLELGSGLNSIGFKIFYYL